MKFCAGIGTARSRRACVEVYHSSVSSYDDDMSIDELRSRRDEILSMAARHGVSNVRVFGSVLHGDDHPDSDIDLLVEVEPGRSLLDIIGLEQELEQLLGRRVEVLTVGGLSPYLEQRILAEAAGL
jgi:predicted nucleotidyltransferase